MADGDGLFLRVLDPGKRVYWVYRYRLNGKDRETSVGSYPAMTLAQARIKHAELRALVLKGIDPVGERRKAKAAQAESDAPIVRRCRRRLSRPAGEARRTGQEPETPAAMARRRWPSCPHGSALCRSTRSGRSRCSTRSTRSGRRRPRPRRACAAGSRWCWISPAGRTTPAPTRRLGQAGSRLKLGSPKKLGKIDRKTGERVERGNHAAMPYDDVPAFMAQARRDAGRRGTGASVHHPDRARTSEALRMTWDEVDFDKALWRVPPSG